MSEETKTQTLALNDKDFLNVLHVHSQLLSRIASPGYTTTHDGKRDYNVILGYPDVIDLQHYVELYLRGGITHRIVKAYPDASWRDMPRITDNKEAEQPTDFEKQWIILEKKFRLLHYFKRLDTISQLGRYAVLYIGFKDGLLANQPFSGKNTEILFVRPFSEIYAKIIKINTNEKDPNYGKPEMYQLTLSTEGSITTGNHGKVLEVHHTRIVHVAEGCLDDDIFGCPRLQPIWNDLINLLYKVVGGSSEIFYFNARGGIAVETDSDVNISPDDVKDIKDQISSYLTDLRRYLFLQGTKTKTIQQEVYSPKDHIDKLIELIAGTTGIPKRKLVGSEAGHLASDQDEKNWSDKIIERRSQHCVPIIINPFINLMIKAQILPKPINGEFEVIYDQQDQIGDVDKSQVAKNITDSMQSFSNAKKLSNPVITDKQYVEDVLGLDYDPKVLDGWKEDQKDESNQPDLDQISKKIKGLSKAV